MSGKRINEKSRPQSLLFYVGEKELMENRGFEDDRLERRTSAEYSVQSLFVIPNNVLSADNLSFSLTTSAQLQT